MCIIFKVTVILTILFVKLNSGDLIDVIKNNEIDSISEKENLTIPNLSVKNIIKTLLKWRYDPTRLGMDPYERIKSFGYPSEKHIVTTEDGYILTVNRIPYGKLNTVKDNRPIVFLQPGLFCTPACFVDVGPQRALAYLLADLGYDVWLGSVRGTTFSRNHTTFNPAKNKKYWDYSWHEVGTIDIPTVIDYILKLTGQEKLSYIGHSQGTTAYFVMASEKPEYNDKIRVMIALAPVAFMNHISKTSVYYILAQMRKEIFPMLRLWGLYDIFPHYDPITNAAQVMCNENVTDSRLCQALVAVLIGYDSEMFDWKDVYTISEHLPGGASIKQLEHYAQLITDGGFKQFNYGKRKNMKKYGQEEPPSYNLTNINTPVHLMYGETDFFTDMKDLNALHEALPHSELFRVAYKNFNHGDFLYGKRVIQLVFNYVFEILEKYTYMK